MAEETWLTVGEAAKLASRDPRTIRTWADRGIVRCRISPGGHRQLALSSLLQAQPTPGRRHTARARVAEPDELLPLWAQTTAEWYGWQPRPTTPDHRLESMLMHIGDIRSGLDDIERSLRREFLQRDNAAGQHNDGWGTAASSG